MEEYLVPDYKGFSNIVEIAVDRVENPEGRKSYSYETFCNIVDLQMDMCGLYGHVGDNVEDEYKKFSLAVASVIDSLREKKELSKEDYKDAFYTIKDLISVYGLNETNDIFNKKTM